MDLALSIVTVIALVEFVLLAGTFMRNGRGEPPRHEETAPYLHEQVKRRGELIEELQTKLVHSVQGTEDVFKAGMRAYNDGKVWWFRARMPCEGEAWAAYCSEKGWPRLE